MHGRVIEVVVWVFGAEMGCGEGDGEALAHLIREAKRPSFL